MPEPILNLSRIAEIEQKLDAISDEENRLHYLNELAEFYTYTNIREAQRILAEQETLLRHFQHPELLLNYYLNTAIVENQFYNFMLSDQHFRQALAIVEDEGNVTQQIEVYLEYAGTLINLNELEKAFLYIERAHRHLTGFPSEILLARVLCREGYLHLHLSDFDKAAELFFQSDKIFSSIDSNKLKIKDLYFKTLVHAGFGNIYERIGDFEKCVQAYLKVVNMCETADMRSRLAWHYLNVGKAYMALNSYENAEAFFRKVDNIPDDISLSARAYAMANMGYCIYLDGRYDEALELYNRAEQIYRRKFDDYDNFSIVSHWKGLVYDAIGRIKKAESQLVEALEYAQLARNPRQQATICRDIAELYAERGDFRNAYDYEVLHNQFTKRYFEEQNNIRMSEFEFKFEAERRRKETEMLRLQATGLQLKALRAQMNPHFMFNALNSIQNYISDDKDMAAKYLAKFARLMRASLEYSELEIISLENEIAFLENYLDINQKLRFDERLNFKITVDEDIEEDIVGVPTMIVQPYIENAIEHGLRPKKGGFIKIDFQLLDDNTILCLVEDNGIGRELARKMQERDGYHLHHKSRGTAITEKRLEILHSSRKDKLSVEVIDLKDPLSMEPLGTRVEIKIPIIEMPYKITDS